MRPQRNLFDRTLKLTSIAALWAAMLLFCGAVNVVSAAERSPAERAYQDARVRYYQLINSQQTGEPVEWDICVGLFRKVSRKYPQHRRASDALFTEALLYWNMHQRFGKRDSLYKAISAYEELVRRDPRNSLADDALYNAAIIHRDNLGDVHQAIDYIERLLREYPKSEMARQARALLPKLKHQAPEHRAAPPTQVPVAESAAPDSTRPERYQVKDIRYWSNPDYTRVSIYVNQTPRFKQHLLKKDPQTKKPWRLFVDLEDSQLDPKLKRQITIKDSLLQRVRSGQFKPDVSRVVLDMNSVYDYEVRARTDPPRIIIDVQGKTASRPDLTASSEVSKETVKKPQAPPAKRITKSARIPTNPPKVASLSRSMPSVQGSKLDEVIERDAVTRQPIVRKKPHKIVLDPGHGGDDPGARGPRGTEEKTVVLQIALKLFELLNDRKDLEVVLTRKEDRSLSLQDRTEIANRERGDLFVSIHANASPKRHASGVSTYIFDNATDDYSRHLEKLENASILKGEKQQPDFLSMMFRSMTRNFFTNQSVELASFIQRSMVGNLKPRYKQVRNLGVRQALFYVLWNTEMPSVLVETSFISNKLEEKRLASAFYQQRLAEGIAKGLESFLEKREQQSVAARGR